MSCRMSPLRVARAFARLFNLSGQMDCFGPPVGRNHLSSDQREDHQSPSCKTRYTRHEVAAPRAVGPSGRTCFTRPQHEVKKSGPSFEGPICLGSLWLGEVFASAISAAISANLRAVQEAEPNFSYTALGEGLLVVHLLR